MTTVYFVRHGEIENPKNIVPLWLPGFALSAVGRAQIETLADQFSAKNIAAIYTSPVQRCRESAAIIGEKLNLPVTVDDRLIELKSPFQGMDKDEFEKMRGEKSLYRFPQQLERGEKPEEVAARMRSFLDEIAQKHKDHNVIAVSHGDPIMVLKYSLEGKDIYAVSEGVQGYLQKGGYIKVEV